jgi:hypothetical protein
MILNSGSLGVYEWYEIDYPALNNIGFMIGTEKYEGPFIILAKKGTVIKESELINFTKTKSYELIRYQNRIFMDVREAFPGKRIVFHHTTHWINYSNYIKENFLQNINADVDIIESRGNYYLAATTLRKGLPTQIKKKIDTSVVPDKQIAEILEYFEKKCPKVPLEETEKYGCGSYVKNILSKTTPELKIYIDDWVYNADKYHDELKIPLELIEGLEHIKDITLKRSKVSKKILSKIRLTELNIEEDDSGITFNFARSFPETVISAMKGRKISEVIDLPWAQNLTIRTAKIGEVGTTGWAKSKGTVVRAFDEIVPFHVDGANVISDDVIKKRLHDIMQSKFISSYDLNCERIFNQMTLSMLYAVISLTTICGKIDIGIFGYTGWTIGRFGNVLKVENCPVEDLGDYLKQRGFSHENSSA